jgi:hypothetical protein
MLLFDNVMLIFRIADSSMLDSSQYIGKWQRSRNARKTPTDRTISTHNRQSPQKIDLQINEHDRIELTVPIFA